MASLLLFGNSGSGKSTLAKKIAVGSALKHLDLDVLAWLPGSPPRRRPVADSEREIRAFTSEAPDWVVEGCYADLLSLAGGSKPTFVFLNPGIEACVENARLRPWESHKYESKAAQDANLEMLIGWIREYESRTDETSLVAHRKVFDHFRGDKIELRSREAITRFGNEVATRLARRA